MKNLYIPLLMCLGVGILLPQTLYSQEITIQGTVVEENYGDLLVGVNIYLKDRSSGTVSNEQGYFEIRSQPPVHLIFSIIGYFPKEMVIEKSQSGLRIELEKQVILGQEVIVSASRVQENILSSPVSIEKIGLLELQETSAGNFYDGLHTVNGVDMMVHGLTFKLPNTRGFNGETNYRLNQLVDGVDNTAPGLSFSAGNIFGVSPLDIHNVELLVGASSALYGPGGMNGTLLMTTKDPFEYPGLSFSIQTGLMNVNADYLDMPTAMGEVNLRYARSFGDKFAFKINAGYLQATDWYAADYRDRTNIYDPSLTRSANPGYDGVNVYGDDIIVPVNLKDVAPDVAEGIAESQGILPGTPEYDDLYNQVISLFPDQLITRTGYHEEDLVDYNTENLRLGTSMHYRFNNRLEAIIQASYGKGTSVYTAINRFSLRDFDIFSGKAELKSPDFFIRTYIVAENSGNTYDAGSATLLLNEAWKPSEIWYEDYIAGFAQHVLLEGTEESAHKFARLLADNRDEYGNVFTPGEPAFPLPGTTEFDSYWQDIISTPVNEGGALVIDHSKVWHIEGMYNFSRFIELFELIMGASHRIYFINSDGTVFLDEPGEPITVYQSGAYTQVTKKLFQERLKLTGSARYDKNEYFKGRFTPRISFVYSHGQDNPQNIRGSYQTAFRFPAIADQWVDFNTGMFTIIGGLPELQEKYGFNDNPVYPLTGSNPISDSPVIENGPFNFLTFGPEKVTAIELGYKGLFLKKMLLIDAYVFQNTYNGFMAYQCLVQNPYTPEEQRFKTTVSTDDPLSAYGWAMSADIRLQKGFDIKANVSSNKLESLDNHPPGFQARFNTPEYRINFSVGNRDIVSNMGFKINWRWQDEFMWESDFGTGKIPSYTTVDLQVNYIFKKLKSKLKVGGSNLLNQYYTTSFGSANIGGLYYFTWTFDDLLR